MPIILDPYGQMPILPATRVPKVVPMVTDIGAIRTHDQPCRSPLDRDRVGVAWVEGKIAEAFSETLRKLGDIGVIQFCQ